MHQGIFTALDMHASSSTGSYFAVIKHSLHAYTFFIETLLINTDSNALARRTLIHRTETATNDDHANSLSFFDKKK